MSRGSAEKSSDDRHSGGPEGVEEKRKGRGPGRGMRADAVRNRSKVIEAAHRMFRETGPGISVRAVAREAGVGLGTIYRHFPDKEALLAAVVEERFRLLARETRRAMDDLGPWEAFVRIMRRMAEMMTEDRAIAGAVMSGQMKPPGEAAGTGEGRDPREDLGEALRELAEAAKASGELRADVDERDLGLFFGGVALSLGPPPGGPQEQPEDEAPGRPWERYLEVVLDGLCESSRGAASK